MDLYYIFDAPDGSENDHVLHIEQNNCIIYLGRGNDEDVEQANKIIEENSKPVGFMMNNKNSETYKFIYNNTMIWLQIDLRDEYYTRKEIKEFWFYFDKL